MIKECPACGRTYSDNAIAFCLADGSLLSAPFDPETTQHLPSPGSLPTEIMNPGSGSLPLTQPAAAEIPRTIASPQQPSAQSPHHAQPAVKPKSNRLLGCAGFFIGLSLMIILAYALWPKSTQRATSDLSTPSAAARAFHAAARRKDVEAWKKTLNAEFLRTSAEKAKQQNISLDAYLKQLLEQGPVYTSGEIEGIQNEKILSNRATLEVKINGKWLQWDFIKENGEWKSL